jgi:hypothetical protein
MPTPLTPEHFASAMRMVAETYNAPISVDGLAMLYRAMLKQAPSMTAELFDYGLQQAICSCRFMPRLVDILEACYERSTADLPKMPDIDPRYANEHQQGIYYRALDARNRALASAPVDTTKPKAACRDLIGLPVQSRAALAGIDLHAAMPF